MPYIKITDPSKRYELVNEYLRQRRAIFDDSLNEQLGYTVRQDELSKLYKPITSAIAKASTDTAKMIQDTLAPVLTSSLPALTAPPIVPALTSSLASAAALPASTALPISVEPTPAAVPVEPTPVAPVESPILGIIATNYMKGYLGKEQHDKTFGIYEHNGEMYIGNSRITFNGDNVIVHPRDTSGSASSSSTPKEFNGTVGLWELITSRDADSTKVTKDDLSSYKSILHMTSALKHENDPITTKSKASGKSDKWIKWLKPIWSELYPKGSVTIREVKPSKTKTTTHPPATSSQAPPVGPPASSSTSTSTHDEFTDASDELVKGDGVPSDQATSGPAPSNTVVYLPQDPMALLDRLDLLLASKSAGNTGVVNEITAIIDELYRLKLIDLTKFKLLNSL